MAINRRLAFRSFSFQIRAALDKDIVASALNNKRYSRVAQWVDDLKSYPRVFWKSWKQSGKRSTPELAALDARLDKEWDRRRMRYMHAPPEKPKGDIRIILEPGDHKSESDLQTVIEGMIQGGEFNRLRRCPCCRKFFFAGGRSDQRYCRRQCRQSAYEATPRRIKANKKRSADYYAENYKSDRKKSRGKR